MTKKSVCTKWEARKKTLCDFRGANISNEAYIENLLYPLCQKLRLCYEKKRSELQTSIALTVGTTNPTSGLSRAMITLRNCAIRPSAQEQAEKR